MCVCERELSPESTAAVKLSMWTVLVVLEC